MLKSTLYWLSAAFSSGDLHGTELGKDCLSQAAQAALEPRMELLRGASWLLDPKVLSAAFADAEKAPTGVDEAAMSKAECSLLQVRPGICLIWCCCAWTVLSLLHTCLTPVCEAALRNFMPAGKVAAWQKPRSPAKATSLL